MKKAAILVMIVATLAGCSKQSDGWTGFYYPEGTPKYGKAVFEAQEFATKDLCIAWADDKVKGNEQATYFCGFQCNYDDLGQYVCNADPVL